MNSESLPATADGRRVGTRREPLPKGSKADVNWDFSTLMGEPTLRPGGGLILPKQLPLPEDLWSGENDEFCRQGDAVNTNRRLSGKEPCVLRKASVSEKLLAPCAAQHRITECLGLEGTSVGHPVQPPAEAGSPTARGAARL